MFRIISEFFTALGSLAGNTQRLSNTVANLDAQINDAIGGRHQPIPIESRTEVIDHTTNGFVPPVRRRVAKAASNGE